MAGSFLIFFAAIYVAGYESKMSSITLINQREQAESELRSNMFRHLITPVSGPHIDSNEIDPHRECVLVKLLALNFHENFELKPLMIHVDKRLAEMCENDTNKLAGMYENDKNKKEKT